MESKLRDVLLSLGITQSYVGYKYLCNALKLVMEDEERFYCMKRNIWEPLDRKYHYKDKGVESAIRTVAKRAWCDNREKLEEIQGAVMKGPPSAGQFLSILYTKFSRCDPEEVFDGITWKEEAPLK